MNEVNDLLLNFFENGFNNKKLKRSREKRGYTLKAVSEKTGIPAPTIQRYEDGTIQKVPLDAVKKICECYGTDYRCYYGWSAFPFLGSISGILFSMIYGISLESIHNGALFGLISGFTAMIGGTKLYDKLVKEKKNKIISQKQTRELIYKELPKEERQRYDEFKIIAETLLKTNEMPDIKEETENLLFTTYLLHVVRKRMGVNICDIIDPRELEKLDETELIEKINKAIENKKIEKIEQK